MAGLSLSLWVLQPLVAGRFLGLGGMRVAYTICQESAAALRACTACETTKLSI